MELHVLSNRSLRSVAEWQRAIEAEKYPLRLTADVQLTTLQGFLPATLNGKQTGFECYQDDAGKTMKFLGSGYFDRRWSFALGFRWRGDIDELDAAWMAATAYASGTGGIIFDHEKAKVLTPEQAREVVGTIAQDRPRFEAFMSGLKQKLPSSI
jgi:hypothetical protein